MTKSEINEIFNYVYGGDASDSYKEKAVKDHIAEYGYKDTVEAIEDSKSTIYWGEVMDGAHDF